LAIGRRAYSVRGFADFDGYRKVLKGQADAMIDPGIQPYDVCPAAVLLREAGGRFTSLDGRDSIYAGSGLGSNGRIHDELLALWAGSAGS
jgi:histidinol-phosphatase